MPEQSPFDPDLAQGGQVPPGTAPAGATSDLANQWRSFASSPEGGAALMQAGIAMLQPRPVGQSRLGQLGNAVAYGGEAAQNVTSQREKELDQQSLRDYRKNTGEAAQAKGDAALYNANTRDLLGMRGATPTSIMQAGLTSQRDAQKAIDSLSPKGGIELDPMGENSGVFQSLKSIDPRIKTKKDVATLWANDQEFKKKVIKLYTADAVQRASANHALPAVRGQAMSDSEGQRLGIYDDNDLVKARMAIARDPKNRGIVMDRLRNAYREKGLPFNEADIGL